MSYAFLADATLIVHLLYIGFVVVSLLVIFLGWAMKWNWVRNPWFRWLHLLAIAIVVFEAFMKITCPLTTLELYYRTQAGQDAHAVDWGEQIPEISDCMWSLRQLLFPGCKMEFFVPIYVGVASLILLSFFLVPPRWPRRWHGWRRRVPSTPL
jgi:hypothetical protein